MANFSSHVAFEFAKAVAEQVLHERANLSEGACEDYAAYKENCGYIRGLLRSVELCQDVETKLNKD